MGSTHESVEKARRLFDELGDAQKAWLEEVARLSESRNNQVSAKKIKAQLDGTIPRDFDPSSLPRALVRFRNQLTILGHIVVAEDYVLLPQMEKTALAVRKVLVEEVQMSSEPSHNEIGLHSESLLEASPELEAERLDFVIGCLGDIGFDIRSHPRSSDPESDCDIWVINDGFNKFYRFELGDIDQTLIEKFFPTNNEPQEEPSSDIKQIPTGRIICPIFRSRVEHVDEKLGFVIMPFTDEKLSGVYENVIQPTLEEEGYQALRADEVYGPVVMEDIWTKTCQAGFVIADLTGTNPNVMYELGIAHTLGKPVVTITQDIENLPFDTQHHRTHPYANDASGLGDLRKTLRKAIPEVVQQAKKRSENGEMVLSELADLASYVRLQRTNSMFGFGR